MVESVFCTVGWYTELGFDSKDKHSYSWFCLQGDYTSWPPCFLSFQTYGEMRINSFQLCPYSVSTAHGFCLVRPPSFPVQLPWSLIRLRPIVTLCIATIRQQDGHLMPAMWLNFYLQRKLKEERGHKVKTMFIVRIRLQIALFCSRSELPVLK